MNKECYEYYKFNKAPFSKIIEKEFLYKPEYYAELISRLEFAIAERELAVITGENGVGKTTYCWYFIEQLKTKHRLGYIPNPRLSVNDFYRESLTSLGVAEPKWIKKDLLDQVKNTLDYLYAESCEQPILLIDESHLLKEIISKCLHRLILKKYLLYFFLQPQRVFMIIKISWITSLQVLISFMSAPGTTVL